MDGVTQRPAEAKSLLLRPQLLPFKNNRSSRHNNINNSSIIITNNSNNNKLGYLIYLTSPP